jgi:UDP-N-acetylmuramate--alanine ligase
VIEADEYDRSFLKLSPDIAVISAMDPDHLDIYGTAEEMEESYIEFTQKIRNNGRLLIRKGLPREVDLAGPNTRTYSLADEAADVFVKNLQIVDGAYRFDLMNQGVSLNGLVLNVGGTHNVENMAAAIGVSMELGIEPEEIRKAVASYAGVKRRFEYGVRTKNRVYIDDYAHHPEELNALIGSVRALYPERRMVVVFQPHLFSRTKDFADGFAAALDRADEVYLLPIYPAREKPVPGVTSTLISAQMKAAKVLVLEKAEVLELLQNQSDAWKDEVVLVTAGAGDIDRMIEPLKASLSNGYVG